MSRCFPYPPPGYTLSRASNEALIESIKLQKEREKARKLKKKEKRREKKEKRKEKNDEPNQSQTSEKTWPDTKTKLLLKGNVAQIEHLEASSLTEEHGLPVRSDVPCTSSDSTNTSNKRKRDSLPLNESHGHGKIFRIKLSSKQNGSNASVNVNEMRLCSKSGSTFAAQKEDSNNNLSHVRENSHSVLKISGEQICSTSSPVEGVTKGKNAILSVPNAVVTFMQREEMNYNELVGNWSTPQLQDRSLDADIDWLFQFKNPAEKRLKIQNDDASCSSSSALRPHAQLLSEVNIYALPFTVPF